MQTVSYLYEENRKFVTGERDEPVHENEVAANLGWVIMKPHLKDYLLFGMPILLFGCGICAFVPYYFIVILPAILNTQTLTGGDLLRFALYLGGIVVVMIAMSVWINRVLPRLKKFDDALADLDMNPNEDIFPQDYPIAEGRVTAIFFKRITYESTSALDESTTYHFWTLASDRLQVGDRVQFIQLEFATILL